MMAASGVLSAGVQNHDSVQRIVVDSSFLMYESVVNGIGVACLPLIYATGLKARGLIPIFPEVSAYLSSVYVFITISRQRPIVSLKPSLDATVRDVEQNSL
ncbi:MAG: hypothetical protein WAO76_00800 [Georgfuchsia sp.]